MKFLWIFSTFAIGGPQRRFAALAPAFGRHITHHIAAMDGVFDAQTLLPQDFQWTRVDLEVEKTSGLSPRNIGRFRNILKSVAPDLVLTSNWGTIEWHIANRGRIAAPHIHFEDGFGPDEMSGKRLAKRDGLRRLLFSQFSPGAPKRSFVAPSSGLGDLFSSAWGAPSQSVHVIANGVEIERFSKSRVFDRMPVTIGSVGALRPEKRFDRLLRCFAGSENSETRLLLVGDGPDREKLHALADELDVSGRVIFAGEQSDVAPFLKSMDIYCVSSDTEQMPISLVEAMASGLPVVATDVGDIKTMPSPEHQSFIVDRDDESAMTAAISTLASDASLRATLGNANAKRAREMFTVERMVERYKAICSDMLGVARGKAL